MIKIKLLGFSRLFNIRVIFIILQSDIWIGTEGVRLLSQLLCEIIGHWVCFYGKCIQIITTDLRSMITEAHDPS